MELEAIKIVKENVSRETFSLLERYLASLLLWNKRINLISRQVSIYDIWKNHILDSLTLSELIIEKESALVDVGSGAGFPGLILAINGHSNCYLIEKNKKKAAFLHSICSELGLKSRILHLCISKFSSVFPKYITSRAVDSICNIVNMTQHLIANNTQYILHIGSKDRDIELKKLSINWNFQLQEFKNPYRDNCTIISIANIEKIGV